MNTALRLLNYHGEHPEEHRELNLDFACDGCGELQHVDDMIPNNTGKHCVYCSVECDCCGEIVPIGDAVEYDDGVVNCLECYIAFMSENDLLWFDCLPIYKLIIDYV